MFWLIGWACQPMWINSPSFAWLMIANKECLHDFPYHLGQDDDSEWDCWSLRKSHEAIRSGAQKMLGFIGDLQASKWAWDNINIQMCSLSFQVLLRWDLHNHSEHLRHSIFSIPGLGINNNFQNTLSFIELQLLGWCLLLLNHCQVHDPGVVLLAPDLQPEGWIRRKGPHGRYHWQGTSATFQSFVEFCWVRQKNLKHGLFCFKWTSLKMGFMVQNKTFCAVFFGIILSIWNDYIFICCFQAGTGYLLRHLFRAFEVGPRHHRSLGLAPWEVEAGWWEAQI